MARVVARDPEAVLAAVREVARERITPAAAEVDRESRFPQENLRAAEAVRARRSGSST
ncbi:MAG: acyl-CoA dehydrogenase family protein [Solirubrobacteraceae bacterium]